MRALSLAFAALFALGLPALTADPTPPALTGNGASPFGLNAPLPSNSAVDAMLDQAADAGIVWYRVELDWPYLEPKAGHFEWDDTDRLVNWAQARDVRLLAVLSRTPYWASFSTYQAKPPLRGSDFAAFVREVARRYRGRIHAFAIGDEPNEPTSYSGSLAFYLHELLIPALREVRAEAPEALTVGPDLAATPGMRENWLAPILQLVPTGLLDVLSLHPPTDGVRPGARAEEIDRFHAVMKQQGWGQKPLWITATGQGVGVELTEVAQAQALRQTMSEMAQRPFWTKTFWYDLHGPSGLLEPKAASNSGVPRLAWFAYRDIITAARTPRPKPAPALGAIGKLQGL